MPDAADTLRGAADRLIATIDALVGAQLDAILHHPRLRRLEGTWRGLAWLVQGIEPGAAVKVKVLNLPWPELCRDLERAAEFDQSQTFRKIYEEEFGMPGGEPYGLLVIDHEVRHRPAADSPTDDVSALAAFAGVAAAAFAPTVLAASPALLDADDFADLATTSDPAAPLRQADHARWRGLSQREDMRFVAVALPRLLARPSWPDDPFRNDGFRYAEAAALAADRVWMNAGFAFAAVVARAFANHAWPADVRGSETDRRCGGLVDGMENEPFASDPAWFRPSLDIALTDRQERALIEAALMPLAALPFDEPAVFASVRSLQRVPNAQARGGPENAARFTGPTGGAANANARLSAQINSMLCVSRFAHYVKLKGRQMVGSFRTADEIERELHDWLQGYVNSNLAASGEVRARFPLAAAQVTVRERPGRPGHFGCTVHLQPHFQLDDVAATFRLVTDLVSPGSQ